MRRNIVLALIFILIVAGFSFGAMQVTREEVPSEEPVDIAGELTKAIEETVNIRGPIDSMSLEEKVGQMFVVGYENSNIIRVQAEFISKNKLGGVILMGPNVASWSTYNESMGLLQKAEVGMKAPLIYSIDEEGGVITRLKGMLTEQTPQSAISNPEMAKNVALNRGRELKQLGFNVVYSPVLDFAGPESFLYDRTFHVPKEEYAQYASAMLLGFREADIAGVPKHFPGHPPGSTDSHFGLPSTEINRDELDSYFMQFTELVNINEPEIIMTGHVMFPGIDSKNPATLSSVFITDILRGELGYEGIVITDDLDMGAIKESYTPEEAGVAAVMAGNDILLYVSEIGNQKRMLDGVIAAVRSGEIPEDRIDESVRRILEFKRSLDRDP